MGQIVVDDRAMGASWEIVSGSAFFFHSVGFETDIAVITFKDSPSFKKCGILKNEWF